MEIPTFTTYTTEHGGYVTYETFEDGSVGRVCHFDQAADLIGRASVQDEVTEDYKKSQDMDLSAATHAA